MPSFRVSGMRNGKPCAVTWENGQLSGTRETVAWLTIQPFEGRMVPTHPEGGAVPMGLDTLESAWYTVPLAFD